MHLDGIEVNPILALVALVPPPRLNLVHDEF